MMRRMLGLTILVMASVLAVPMLAQEPSGAVRTAHEIFKQLIEINTTDSAGNVSTASEAMAKRFLDAGFDRKDVVVAGPNARKKNLVVRYRGTGKKKPVLFIGHLDVVEARRENWTTDPFQFVEKDGYFYGRGTQDMKAGDAILVTSFIRLKKEGFVPDRDLILALTADEEGGTSNGVDWLLRNHRDWIEAEYCINLDGGEFEEENGKRLLASLQASEKVYADFRLETHNPGGHSSVPVPDNAIYELASALLKVQAYTFPTEMNEITRNYFLKMASLTTGPTADDMRGVAKEPPDQDAVKRLSKSAYFNALLRTTCVATMLKGGHAPNALPGMAQANVNCRIFPGEAPEEVRKTLEKVINDPGVSITPVLQIGPDGKPVKMSTVPPSPLNQEVIHAEEHVVDSFWPGLPVVPTMSTGASDGAYLRVAGIPTYGIACMFYDMNDIRAHGKDERQRVQYFDEGVEVGYRLIKTLGS